MGIAIFGFIIFTALTAFSTSIKYVPETGNIAISAVIVFISGITSVYSS